MAKDWESIELWRKHTERQLYELGALVRGQVPTVSARINDVLEQIQELRTELQAVKEKQDKMAEFLKQHVKKENGNGGK